MLAVTLLYIALGGLLMVVLTALVVMRRREKRIGLGDGGDAILQRRTRAHGNAAETLPMSLLMLAAFDLSGGAPNIVHGFGIVLIAGRLFHAYGVLSSSGSSPGRLIGMVLTMAVQLGLAGMLLWDYWVVA
jgi:hypothetical protein